MVKGIASKLLIVNGKGNTQMRLKRKSNVIFVVFRPNNKVDVNIMKQTSSQKNNWEKLKTNSKSVKPTRARKKLPKPVISDEYQIYLVLNIKY